LLIDMGRNNKGLGYLSEIVRQKLDAAICQGLLGDLPALSVLTLDPSIEQVLLESIRAADASTTMVVEPNMRSSC